MTTETDHVRIDDTWTFESASVAEGFGAHVREQLPWYDLVTSAIVQIARHYIPRGGLVYDIGASDGNIGRALAPVLADRGAELIGIEPSAEMVKKYEAPGKVIQANAEDHAFAPFDLGIAMLAFMFVSPSRTPELIEGLRAKIKPGGALVVVERMLPPGGYPAIITSRLTLAAKLAKGASPEQIIAKELSLAGVQRPLSLPILGDEAVEWFRFGDFAGYLIEAA
jgi:tRNA (cmo5U34)-methyltransferase